MCIRDSILDTQALVTTDDGGSLKHKVIYIAGFLSRKYKINDASESFSSDFLDSLNRGGLTVPTLNVAFFVHSAMEVYDRLPIAKKHCQRYVVNLLRHIDVSFAADERICRTLTNTMSKAYVLNESDREKEICCLRCQEKLSENK